MRSIYQRRAATALGLAITTASAMAGLTPAFAQSYYFSAPAGSGPVGNASTTLERLTPQDVSASGTINTKGSASPSLGTTSATWSAFQVYFYGYNAGHRFLCDLSFDNGATWAVQNLFSHPNTATAGAGALYSIPLRVPAGSVIKGRCQSSSASAGVRMIVIGEVATSSRAPGYSTFTALNVDTANTKAGTQDVTMASASWVSILDPAPAAYSAVLASVDVGTTGPAAPVWGEVFLAVGPSGGGSEVDLASFGVGLAQSGGVPRRHVSPLLPVAIPAGSRVSAKVAPVTGTDTTAQVRVALYGLN